MKTKIKQGSDVVIQISASKNSKCKYIKSLEQKKNRIKYGEYIIEGIKNVSEALNSDKTVTAIYISESFFSEKHFNYPKNVPAYKLTDAVFEGISSTKTPQGILASVKIDTETGINADLSKCYIYCDGINDPGNLGTIIRTADAAGFGGVMLSEGCVDLYSPKVIRSTMGSIFHIETETDVTYERLSEYKSMGFQILGGALEEDSIDFREADYTRPTIIIVGNEANGMSQNARKLCEYVKIPIIGQAESLNAGVAAAILMYEAVRQRT